MAIYRRSTIGCYLNPMGTWPDHAENAAVRALRGRHVLLDTYIGILNQLDNPIRRRAAKFRQEQRPRRDISVIRGPRTRDFSSGLSCVPGSPDSPRRLAKAYIRLLKPHDPAVRLD